MARTEAAILTGDTFPGHHRAQQRSVLHVNRDDLVDGKWLALYAKIPGLWEIAHDHLAMCEPPRAFRPEQILPMFLQVADQIAQARPAFQHRGALVVIDTFRTFVSIEENSSQEVSECLSALREVTAANGPFPDGPLWASHHTPWQQVGVEAHERGSSAFRGDVDEPLMLRNLRQERKRQEDHNKWQKLKGYRVDALPPLTTTTPILTVTRLKGKLAELDPLAPDLHTFTLEPVTLERPGGGFYDSAWLVPADLSAEQVETISAEHARELRNTEDAEKVLAVVVDHAVTTKAEIAKYANLTRDRATLIVNALVASGRLEKPRYQGGPYRLPSGENLSTES